MSVPETRAGDGREVLVAEDLHKSYGPRPALRGLSFSLKERTILGFLGPNGAGKTTAIRILTTIIQPSAGRFRVAGLPSDRPQQIRRRIGVLPESLGFPGNMTGTEFVTYYGRLYGLSAGQARAKAQAMIQAVGLKQRGRSLIKSYSRGMRQRLGIARALINDPAVVFLDEPTLGLDPKGQQELQGLVRWIARERNAGVILCSHQLSEVETVCDEVVILSTGRVVAQGSVAEVIGGTDSSVLRVHVPAAARDEARRALLRAPGVETVQSADGEGWLRIELAAGGTSFTLNGQHVNNVVLNELIKSRVPVLGLQTGGGRLQDVFLEITQGAIE
ncbi:MAG: ABC transporter ATP-binding protein [Gemmatimonadota bacterium]|jgi:ABC-2 type transport system ATP-binding protein